MSRAIEIRVTASYKDDHMCQGVVTGQVSNFILQSTALSVRITGTGITNTVNLVSTQAVDVVERTWTGSWTVPTDAAGQMLDFQFNGIVSDKPCAAHPASKDTDVSLDGYKGRFAVVKVDLDVDANYDGKIDDADEPLEEDPGGLVCVSTNQLTQIKLKVEPAGLTGKVTLYSNVSTNIIRLWENPDRTGELDMTGGKYEWLNATNMPSELWVEGVTNSADLADIELKLEYAVVQPGASGEGERCKDTVRLTVIRVELKEGATVINEGDYVYITGTPQMPQLTASLKPTDLPSDAKWKLLIEYKRSPRNDDKHYPGPMASSWKTLPAGATWNIASEFDTDFRGGKATLYCEYQGVPCYHVFYIRGNNPTEAAAETEIGANPWYVKPIAKWESDRPTQGRYYAQFNTVGTLGPNTGDFRWCPNFGAPNGWGIMQMDPPPTDETLWNWKTNIADGKAHLNDPCATEAQTWITAQENQQQAEEPTMPLQNYVFTFNGVDFQKGTARTPIDACTIQRYNGARLWVIYWKNKTPTAPGSWEIRGGTYRQYVDDVCGEVP